MNRRDIGAVALLLGLFLVFVFALRSGVTFGPRPFPGQGQESAL